ncbi:MAG: CotH kinase family protein [Bacteroidales bacterium]|nr:CotH kinase family protein [Bacteroidales bacterium]
MKEVQKISGFSVYRSMPGFYLSLFLFVQVMATAQINIDTLCNWDNINLSWNEAGVSTEPVLNPDNTGINPSALCLEAVTSSGAYDLIYSDFDEPFNFDEFPQYRLKVLAPATGGSILLKFENSDLSSWVEIEKTPEPGEWDELEFDFTGTVATDYTRMVIFFDFLGSNPNQVWHLDDVLRISGSSSGLTSNLPIILINTYGNPIPDEPKIDGEMKIIDNGYGNLNNQYDPPNGYNGFIGIEVRGQSAQMYPKKSYGFETRDEDGENLNVSLLGMPEENDWILYAPFSDKSMLRNFISFYMGSKLDPYCSRMAYCEVFVNNNYRGVYILMEKIKKDDNRVSIATLKPEDISGDELTGGYICRVDKIDPGFVMGYDGWTSSPNPPYPNAKEIIFQYYYPEPEDLMPEQKNYIQNYIANAENALISSFFSNPDAGYNKYFNTGSFIDHMILREIAKEVDSYRYSTYLYKEKESDGGKLFAGPPWDFNLGYANIDYWDPGVDYTGWIYPVVEPFDYGIMYWWKRLMEDPFFNDLFFTRWQELRQDQLSDENLLNAIDSITGYFTAARERNYQRWPILGQYVWPNFNWQGNDYDDEVEFFTSWLFNRLNWMDNNITGNILSPQASLTGNYPELQITLSDDYFSREVLKNKYFQLNNASAGIDLDTVIHENASSAKLILKGTPSSIENISVTIDKKVINSFHDLSSNQITINLAQTNEVSEQIKLFYHNHTLHLKCTQPEELGPAVKLIDLSGRTIFSHELNKTFENDIRINMLNGMYLCTFKYADQTITKKVIISD